MTHWILQVIYSQYFVTLPFPTKSWAGKTVIVTGASGGLGFEAARHFARLGAAKVIIAARSSSKSEAAKHDIEASTQCGADVVECWPLDLCSYDSVKAFAQRCHGLPRLDAMVENAGVSLTKFGTAEGDETTVTVNVISTFLLALLALPKMKETARQFNTRPTLSIVTSEVHQATRFPELASLAPGESIFDSLADESKARMSARYAVTKLLEVLAAREMVASKASRPDYPVTINLLNPGLCHSELAREMPVVSRIFNFVLWARPTEVGSRTLVSAAGMGRESHGQYLSDCDIAPVGVLVRSPAGKEMQVKVWKDLSQRLEGISPGILQNL
ncbi:short-chain dehydrogenase/reductase [Lepidopterella palustris CBS 459.81]|uniref:Short-chain dehydrogenase/reductase n=1 Tax=Lepidopterella palustris CBS 459.81 TaxID=1314670 RepID=A0A8E2JEM3_9PEZI|nr:short-chain dehydrogenase/reductase [Lepidopterella palustris CBS 459.81]